MRAAKPSLGFAVCLIVVAVVIWLAAAGSHPSDPTPPVTNVAPASDLTETAAAQPPAPREDVASAEGTGAANDPYAKTYEQGAMAAYLHRREQLVSDIKDLYFAVGCGVVPSEGAIISLVQAKSASLEALAESGERPILDTAVSGMVTDAARDGQQAATEPGKCAWWDQHPQAVYELRRDAALAPNY